MRVFYFYRDDTVHDRRFMTALGKQAVDVIALRLESRVKMTDGWKPPGNVSVVTWSCGDKSFRWSYLSSFTKEMKELIGDNNPDVIHAGPIDICGYLAARSGFKPLVAMSWGYDLLVNAEKNIFSRNRIRYT
ncbi:MAG: glycosyltransferase, partial [Anaerolineaceae bacterium]